MCGSIFALLHQILLTLSGVCLYVLQYWNQSSLLGDKVYVYYLVWLYRCFFQLWVDLSVDLFSLLLTILCHLYVSVCHYILYVDDQL